MVTKYEYIKEWRKKNPGYRTEEGRKYRKKHPEVGKKAKEKYRNANLQVIREKDKIAKASWRKANPEAQRLRMQRYLDRQKAARVEIAGRPMPEVCEVCNELHIRIVFDHCHASNEFRGWLCDRCNRVLGLLKDDSNLFRKLADYLDGFNGQIDRTTKKQAP